MRKGNTELAIAYFNTLVEKNIKPAAAHFNLGRCYFKLANHQETKRHLYKALEYDYSDSLVKSIIEMTNWRMLSSHEYFNNWPAFSNDSTKIAYTSARKCSNNDGKINSFDCTGLYVVDLRTGVETNLVTDGFYSLRPLFSPDDNYVVYLSIRTKFDKNLPIDNRANPALYMMDLRTGEERLLLDERYKVKPYWFYPDGKKLLFSGWVPGNRISGIYSLDIATKELKTVVPGVHENTFPSISRNGGFIVYSSWRRDTNGDGVIDIRDNTGIYIMNLSTGNESLIASDRFNNIFPSISPDSKSIMYLSFRRDTNGDGHINQTDNPGVYVTDLSTGKTKTVINDSCFNKFPSFTPDSKNIVFLSSWRDENRESSEREFFESKGIYVADISSGRIKNLVSDKYYGSYFPVVSPDGKKVVYISWRRDTNRGLYTAYLDRLPEKNELMEFIDKNI